MAILYQAHRSEMGTGDVLEFCSHSMLGRLIRWKTGKDVNHTALIIEADFLGDKRLMLLEALGAGIAPNFLSNRITDFDGEIYWLKLQKEWGSRKIDIMREALKYVGTPYDYGSIFKQLFRRVSVDFNKLFCSEFGYNVLQKVGIAPLLPTAPYPGEMCDLGCFENRIRIL